MQIAVHSKQRGGKDTVSGIITELCPWFERDALADPMKEAYSRITGWPREFLEHQKNTVPEIRKQIIFLGQARKSLVRDTYWVDKVAEKDNIVIPDLRFKIEVDGLRNSPHKCVLIHIERPRHLRALGGTLSNEDHASETDLDDFEDWDYMIDNSGSKSQLREKVVAILKELELIK